MRALDSLSRDELAYAINMLICLLEETHRPQADPDFGITLVDLLGEIGGKTADTLMDYAREIWREENYGSAEEWEEEKRLLGL
jgi:hypothetical protein